MGGVLLTDFDYIVEFTLGGMLWASIGSFDLFFAWLRKLPHPFGLANVTARISRTLFVAVALFSVITILDARILLIRVLITDSYGPRAVDLLVWSLFAVVVLAPRFKWKLVPAVLFFYGFEELFWNTEFNIGHVGDPYLSYLSTPYWSHFFMLMVGFFVVGYLVVRPRLKWSWVVVPAVLYFAFDFALGMPIGASIPQMLAHPWWPYNYVYELGWQLSYLGIIWGCIRA